MEELSQILNVYRTILGIYKTEELIDSVSYSYKLDDFEDLESVDILIKPKNVDRYPSIFADIITWETDTKEELLVEALEGFKCLPETLPIDKINIVVENNNEFTNTLTGMQVLEVG